jgi:hypothetical protein
MSNLDSKIEFVKLDDENNDFGVQKYFMKYVQSNNNNEKSCWKNSSIIETFSISNENLINLINYQIKIEK